MISVRARLCWWDQTEIYAGVRLPRKSILRSLEIAVAAAVTPRAFGVVDDLSEKIRECYRHAEDCERQAAWQTNPDLRKSFLDTAASWVKLAKTYESMREDGSSGSSSD
jgi:hypothetical protein